MQCQAPDLALFVCCEFDYGVNIFEEEASFRLGEEWILELASRLGHQAITLECDQNVEPRPASVGSHVSLQDFSWQRDRNFFRHSNRALLLAVLAQHHMGNDAFIIFEEF